MGTDVLRVEGVTKSFGEVRANDDVSLRVRAGEVVGLLGHNGAGKTTLVSQIVGLLRPAAGTIRVAHVDAVADPAAARRRVALQAQAQAPLDGLTPRTAIELAGRIRGLRPQQARRAAEELAAELDILPWLDRRALPEGRGISGGVRRLTAFAMAVVAPTPLVVLDEPTNDIDASRRRRLWTAVRRLGDEGSGVLLVTHNVVEAERVVDELVVMDRGKVVAAGSPAQLRGSDDTDLRLELHLQPGGQDPTDPGAADPDGAADPTVDGAAAQVGAVPVPVSRRVRSGRRVLLTIPAAAASTAVSWATDLNERGRIDGYALAPATLEDAYLAVTASDEAAPQEPTRV